MHHHFEVGIILRIVAVDVRLADKNRRTMLRPSCRREREIIFWENLSKAARTVTHRSKSYQPPTLWSFRQIGNTTGVPWQLPMHLVVWRGPSRHSQGRINAWTNHGVADTQQDLGASD